MSGGGLGIRRCFYSLFDILATIVSLFSKGQTKVKSKLSLWKEIFPQEWHVARPSTEATVALVPHSKPPIHPSQELPGIQSGTVGQHSGDTNRNIFTDTIGSQEEFKDFRTLDNPKPCNIVHVRSIQVQYINTQFTWSVNFQIPTATSLWTLYMQHACNMHVHIRYGIVGSGMPYMHWPSPACDMTWGGWHNGVCEILWRREKQKCDSFGWTDSLAPPTAWLHAAIRSPANLPSSALRQVHASEDLSLTVL